MIQSNRLSAILFAVLCTACQEVAISPTSRPSPSPTPSPTPIPAIQIASHNLVPGSNPAEWRVIGLIENQGSAMAADIELGVALLDAKGESIAEASTDALVSNLAPGEAGPFVMVIESDDVPVEARVEVLDFAPADGHRAELTVEFEDFFLTGNGELAVLGFVANQEARFVSVKSLSFLGRGFNGREKLAAVMFFGPGHLAPGELVPFLALAPEDPGTIRWIPYHDGLISEASNTGILEIRGEPVLRFTAQGAPYVVGTIDNSSASAMVGSVLVSLYEGNQLIGLKEIETPRPLQPREQLPFAAFGFPGVGSRFDPSEPSALRFETRVEAEPAERAAEVALAVDISAFVSVGSGIFIRGTIQNPLEADVDAATVYAEVRSSLGELVTAGWSEVGPLDPASTAEFVLDLPIPPGLEAALIEYDLRAIGLEAQP